MRTSFDMWPSLQREGATTTAGLHRPHCHPNPPWLLGEKRLRCRPGRAFDEVAASELLPKRRISAIPAHRCQLPQTTTNRQGETKKLLCRARQQNWIRAHPRLINADGLTTREREIRSYIPSRPSERNRISRSTGGLRYVAPAESLACAEFAHSI
jgi:hypothetical protein